MNTPQTHETTRLVKLEAVIAGGKKAFVAVGLALAEIKQNKMYQLCGFDTFEGYCKTKWNFTRQYANYLVNGAEAVESLPEEMTTIVTTESQARELSKVEPEQREAVLQEAVKRGPVTAKSIKEVADEIEQDEPERPRVVTHEADMEPVISELDVVMEDIKVLLDKILKHDFDKRDLLEVALELKKAARKIENVAATAD